MYHYVNGGFSLTYMTAVILGLVQGVAEFLPISSSGHLSLLQNFMGLTNVEQDHMFFDVLLHLGTLVSVLVVYRKDVGEMICEFFRGIAALFSRHSSHSAPPPARRLVLMIIVATLPLFAVLPIQDAIGKLYGNTIFISCALIVTGFLLFISDRMARGRKTAKNATVLDALLVGCAQAIATVPGLSRSGTTIAAGLGRGFDRSFAVRFSFLMSLPAVLGANILSLADAVQAGGIDSTLLPMYLVGVLVAMISGYFAIRLVKILSAKGKFGKFAYYCWIVGAVTLVIGIVKFAMPA